MPQPRTDGAKLNAGDPVLTEARRKEIEAETSLVVYLLQGAAFLVILVGLFALAGFRG